MVECPKCGFADGDVVECRRCGIIFARWRGTFAAAMAGAPREMAAPEVSSSTRVAVEDERFGAPPHPRISREGWICFGAGLLAALAVFAFPFLRVVLSAFTTLVHEIGHAAAGWLFGYPSVPAFDFSYGGGVTIQQDRVLLLVLVVIGVGLFAIHHVRAHRETRNLGIVLLGVYLAVAATRAHEFVILAMGHGAELAFAALALHRALSGRGVQVSLERPLYGFLGWFLVLSDVVFAWQLRTSAHHREMYGEAKGGGHWMDFSRLANEFLGVQLETVATVFLGLSLLPPLLVLLLQRRADETDMG